MPAIFPCSALSAKAWDIDLYVVRARNTRLFKVGFLRDLKIVWASALYIGAYEFSAEIPHLGDFQGLIPKVFIEISHTSAQFLLFAWISVRDSARIMPVKIDNGNHSHI